MCWNKEVSLGTFVLAMVGVIYLHRRNKPNDGWLAVFAGTVALIQLSEVFMWSDQKCKSNLNIYASMFALAVLMMEPLMNMVGGLFFSQTSNKVFLWGLLAAYLLFVGILWWKHSDKKRVWCGTSDCGPSSFLGNKGCNLQWKFMEGFSLLEGGIWVMFLVLPFLAMVPFTQGLTLFGLGLGSLGLAYFTNNAAVGSLWCWYGAGIVLYKILAG